MERLTMAKTNRPHRFTEPCDACNGEGQRDDAPEGRGEPWSPVWTGAGDLSRECEAEGCDDGRVPCVCQLSHVEGCVPLPYAGPDAPGAYDTDRACDPSIPLFAGCPGWAECADCSGPDDYTRRCESCDGVGAVEDACECGEEFSSHPLAYVGDGGIRCYHCVDRTCPECGGNGEIPIPATIPTPGARIPLARHWTVVDGACAMCGARPHNHDDRVADRSWCHVGQSSTYGTTWVIVRAGLCDSDGVYYAALCAGDGSDDGCLDDVLAQQNDIPEDRADRLAALTDVMPDEWADGIASEMADTL